MDNLPILSNILQRKEAALSQILSITENQASLYESLPSDEEALKARLDFFTQMADEKQTLIDEIIKMDEVFAQIFEGMGDRLETVVKAHAAEFKAIQAQVAHVMELDVKVRAMEDRTMGLITAERNTLKKQKSHANANKAQLLNLYKANAKRKDGQ